MSMFTVRMSTSGDAFRNGAASGTPEAHRATATQVAAILRALANDIDPAVRDAMPSASQPMRLRDWQGNRVGYALYDPSDDPITSHGSIAAEPDARRLGLHEEGTLPRNAAQTRVTGPAPAPGPAVSVDPPALPRPLPPAVDPAARLGGGDPLADYLHGKGY